MADQTCLRCGQTEAVAVVLGSDRLYGTTNETFQVVRCTQCGMLRLFPRPEESELRRYYPAQYWMNPAENTVSSWAERYRRLVLRDHVRFVLGAWRSASGGRSLLDVGMGGGLLPAMLRGRGVPAVGLDVSAAACAIAWRRQGVPAITGDLLNSPLRQGAFRVVTLFHTLEHLSDPLAFLEAARLLLADEGRLVVQVPNADSWQFRMLGRRWNGLDIPRHLNNFRTADLRVILARAGFAVVREKQFSLRDNPAGLATSMAPGLDPMARSIRGKASSMAHALVYFGLVAGALPLAVLEAAAGHGSSVMMEAKKQ